MRLPRSVPYPVVVPFLTLSDHAQPRPAPAAPGMPAYAPRSVHLTIADLPPAARPAVQFLVTSNGLNIATPLTVTLLACTAALGEPSTSAASTTASAAPTLPAIGEVYAFASAQFSPTPTSTPS